MKPIVFPLIAMMCYAVSNVLLELKFSKYNNLTLMVVFSSVICISALTVRRIVSDGSPLFEFPRGSSLIIAVVMGLIFATGDYFYVGAYTNGGNLLTIAIITVMFPVFAALIKFAIVGGIPNKWQISGYILAAVAVILVTRGSMVSTK